MVSTYMLTCEKATPLPNGLVKVDSIRAAIDAKDDGTALAIAHKFVMQNTVVGPIQLTKDGRTIWYIAGNQYEHS